MLGNLTAARPNRVIHDSDTQWRVTSRPGPGGAWLRPPTEIPLSPPPSAPTPPGLLSLHSAPEVAPPGLHLSSLPCARDSSPSPQLGSLSSTKGNRDGPSALRLPVRPTWGRFPPLTRITPHHQSSLPPPEVAPLHLRLLSSTPGRGPSRSPAGPGLPSVHWLGSRYLPYY